MKPIFRSAMFGFHRDDVANFIAKQSRQYEKKIAELEEYIKGNEQDAKAFVNGWHKDLKTELKQFTEMLKEKVIRPCDLYDCVTVDDIDETLKEFINKGE